MTGLFFGSFNPIHNGHLRIARYLLEQGLCKEIWFIVSPQNPFKKDNTLLEEQKRLEIVRTALTGDPRMQVSDVEFDMPRPSYTIDTLELLSIRYPDKEFALIIGGDNLRDFHRWKDYQRIAENYRIFVYPRPGIDTNGINYPNVSRINAPLSSVSSTGIREKIQRGEEISGWVPVAALPLILKEYT